MRAFACLQVGGGGSGQESQNTVVSMTSGHPPSLESLWPVIKQNGDCRQPKLRHYETTAQRDCSPAGAARITGQLLSHLRTLLHTP